MLSLYVYRQYRLATYTISKLYADGHYLCDILEDTDRGLNSVMTLDVLLNIKRKGITAIPTGTYSVVPHTSTRFKSRSWAKPYNGILPMLKDVPGFEAVLIHVGNVAEDTEGCLLTGYNTTKGRVNSSTKAFDILMHDFIIPAWNNNEPVSITISRNPLKK